MIVLSDNDVLIKLACCDLFNEFLDAFEIQVQDVQILKTTRFSATSRKQQKKMGQESYDRLVLILNTLADVTIQPEAKTIEALTEQTSNNIDAGEAVLFATCVQIPDSIIMTGDKRSLAGLVAASATDTVCQQLYQAISGKVICFEQVLSKILDRFGFEAIRQRLIDGRECDRGLILWLGSGLDATESKFREGLRSYLDDARRKSGILLHP